jgi:hypothetical protein
MILLFSSAGEEIYKQFILQVLCYPHGFTIPDVPYSLGRVNRPFDDAPEGLIGKTSAIVFVDYVVDGKTVEPTFLPLRLARIEKAMRFAGKLLLHLTLGEYMHYDDTVRRAYTEQIEQDASRRWNRVIRQTPNTPSVTARPSRQIDGEDPSSWGSGGKFVVEIEDGKLDFSVPAQAATKIRGEYEDWKSTVDMIADRKQLRDKLFYQICGVSRSDKSDEVIPLRPFHGKSVYEIRPGDSLDLVLHFYYGSKKRTGDRRVLDIITESPYLATLGRTSIDVYPEQISGKIEKLRIIAKKQLSEEFTRLAIREGTGTKDTSPKEISLTATQLDIRIRPRQFYVATIMAAFLLGTLFNALPEHASWSSLLGWLGVYKILGSGLMAVAFFLAFSKFPSKSGG